MKTYANFPASLAYNLFKCTLEKRSIIIVDGQLLKHLLFARLQSKALRKKKHTIKTFIKLNKHCVVLLTKVVHV